MAEEADEPDTREKFVLWSKSDKHSREGTVLDIDTGVLRRNHVLVLRSPQAEITLALGNTAAALMDFAQKGETRNDPLLAACSDAEQSIASGDFETTRDLGVPDVIATIENPALRRLALVECFLAKASPDDPEHPGYPAGDPDGRGGEFEPKDETEQEKERIIRELKSENIRREFFVASRAVLIAIGSLPVDAVPGPDVASVAATLIEIAHAAAEIHSDDVEMDLAIDFIKNGPFDLATLQVDDTKESFSSFDAFKKVFPLIGELSKRFGSFPGIEYHHMVEQGGENEKNFAPEQLHNTDNIVMLPKMIHQVVNGEYSKQSPEDPKLTVREWLQKQPYEKQREHAITTLQKLGILKK
jgi:hypothetical protein